MPASSGQGQRRSGEGRHASRLRRRYNSRKKLRPSPRTRRLWHDILTGVVAGAIVGVAILGTQLSVEDQRIASEVRREDIRQHVTTRLENLRFVRALSSPEELARPFRGLDLSGLDLAGLDLSYADFEGANLAGANLRGTNLVGANLSKTDLSRADLSEADLTGAVIFEPIVTETNFSSTNLAGAKIGSLLTGSNPFESASFDDAILTGADVTNVDFSSTQSLDSNSIAGAYFTGVDLSNVSMNDQCGGEEDLDDSEVFARLTEKTRTSSLEELLDAIRTQSPLDDALDSRTQSPLEELLDSRTQSPLDETLDSRTQTPVEELLDAARSRRDGLVEEAIDRIRETGEITRESLGETEPSVDVLSCEDDEYLYCADATIGPHQPGNTSPEGKSEECLALFQHIHGAGDNRQVNRSIPADLMVDLVHADQHELDAVLQPRPQEAG